MKFGGPIVNMHAPNGADRSSPVSRTLPSSRGNALGPRYVVDPRFIRKLGGTFPLPILTPGGGDCRSIGSEVRTYLRGGQCTPDRFPSPPTSLFYHGLDSVVKLCPVEKICPLKVRQCFPPCGRVTLVDVRMWSVAMIAQHQAPMPAPAQFPDPGQPMSRHPSLPS